MAGRAACPRAGEWRYDKSLLEMTKDGDTYTFKALKEGKATATYTVDGVPHTVTVTVTDKSSTIPQTDDMSNLWLWTLLASRSPPQSFLLPLKAASQSGAPPLPGFVRVPAGSYAGAVPRPPASEGRGRLPGHGPACH